MQQTIDADRERARQEELERQEADKEKEQLEAVKEKPKAKTKKEKKKEAKPEVDTAANSEGDNANKFDQESQKRSISLRKVLFYSFLLWFFVALGVVFVIARSPHIIEELIAKLPGSYRTTLLYHLEKIHQEIFKYLK